MMRLRQDYYLRASKRDKAYVARHIVNTIRQLNPPEEFLKKVAMSWLKSDIARLAKRPLKP